MTAKKHVRAAVLTLTMVLAVLPVSAAAQELVAGGRAVGIQMTTDGVVVAPCTCPIQWACLRMVLSAKSPASVKMPGQRSCNRA